MEPRLSLVTLAVADPARSRRFYVDGLGWPASKASTAEIVLIQLGPLALALFRADAFAEEIGTGSKGTGPGILLAQNVQSPAMVAQVLAEPVAAGGRIVRPARQTEWGGTSGYFADPDGHHWEIAHNPFFALDDRGALHLP